MSAALEQLIAEAVSVKPHGLRTIVERVHECDQSYGEALIKITTMNMAAAGRLQMNNDWEYYSEHV